MLQRTLSGFILGVTLVFSQAQAAPAPESFADLVEKLTPAVVNISTTQTVEGGTNPFEEMFSQNMPENSPFNDLPELFKHFYGENGNGAPTKHKTNSLGSGFIISPEGYIVTNHHVVDKAEEITVIFSDDSKMPAKVIGTDAKTDIAVLKVDSPKPLPSIRFGNSDKARVGDWVIAIGNPFGLGGSVSAGIISARARDINAGPFDDFIQTDAAINRGNSGGPLFNTAGEVIGVNSAIFSPSGGNVGIGFAVPAALAEPVIQQLKETGHIQRGWLGVKIQMVTDEIAESLGLTSAKGALVLDVTPESPAAKAGILSGDVILKFDNQDVLAMRKLPRIVAETPVNKKVPVVVWRGEQEKTLLVTVAELTEDKEEQTLSSESGAEAEPKSSKADKVLLGLGMSDIGAAERKFFSLDKEAQGVVIVSIDPESTAAEKPLAKGDIISAINQKEVASVKEAEEQISKAIEAGRKSILLLVSRGGETLFVALPAKEEKPKKE